MTELLMEPAKYPGCSGARNLHDNISDLRAQVAANIKGISLVKELISFYGMSVVMAYMGYIQENAELCVRDMLREICQKAEKTEKGSVFAAVDHLDDGSILQLEITIDEKEGSAVFDFTGTGPQVAFNLNAPQTITRSAVLYCLRCLVGHNVPLNQGCFKPITLVIPKGSFLDPSDEAAVIGGNVETSQRLVDVVLKAFKVCAASQGSMNNVTFGSGSFGYYETVAGGAGAGPHWNGRSGVHTHMTNTRITDPEIMERRYPVILTKFHLNPGTGGEGLFTGGDGVVREMLFRTPLQLSVLSDRRVYQPYGMEGGQPGSLGLNTLILKNGAVKDLGGRATVQVEPGDTFRLETPSGGGYGNKEANDRVLPADTPPAKRTKAAQK